MKSLIKLFGALFLITTPVVTIVACSSEDTNADPRDIQNSALALLRDNEFKMTELGIATTADLQNLQSNNFKSFSTQLQNNISTFLANELKKSTDQHPTQWYYDDAVVVVDNGTGTDAAFTLPLGNGVVNGHLSVKLSVTYKNLPAISKDIKLTFNNDTTSNQEKTVAMGNFIKNKITSGSFPIVDVATLPSSQFTIDKSIANSILNISIVPYLRQTIDALIQYQDLQVIIMPYYDASPVTTSFFTIVTPTIINNKLQFNGTLKNITISFNIGDKSTNFKIDPDKIAVKQSETNAVNQVSDAFFDQALALDATTLPTATNKITDYPNLKSQIITNAVDSINNSYTDIIATDITITNENTSTFTVSNDKTGYFILDFSVTHTYTQSVFTVSAQNIKITVSLKS